MERELFEEIGAAAANRKSENFKDGRGICLVLENIYRRMNEGPTFVARLEVLKVEPKNEPALAPFQPGRAHVPIEPPRPAPCNAVGEQIGWVQKTQKFASAKANVKAYTLELVGKKEAEVSPADFAEALMTMTDNNPKAAGKQPGRGMLIRFDTYRQKTQKGANIGQINTYVNWSHVPRGDNPNDEWSNHPAQVARRRAELDKTKPLSTE